MILSSLARRSGTARLVTSSSATLFAIAFAFAIPVSVLNLWAEDQNAEAKLDDVEPDFAIPDGNPEEIMEFVEKLKNREPKFANRRERIEYIIKMHRAFISAGDKILNQKCDNDVAVKAAQMKLGSLTLLAANDIGDSAKEAMDAATRLKTDKRAAVRKVVDEFWPMIRMANISTMTADSRKELVEEFLTDVSESQFSRQSLGAASQLGDILSDKGFPDEAGELLDRLAKLAKDSDDPKLLPYANQFESVARRLRLPGHFMSLEGKVLNGDELDWASYRGKVVLVDFWATWCGPCIAELPNVKKNYKKYHSKGFDVVGISLDKSREPLDEFIKKEKLPWTQLYDEEIQNGNGWDHPMARHFGINAIPAAILVDKEGKVVSLHARGDELTKLLDQLLGKD